MDFVKALIPGTLLTLLVSGIMGSNRSKGGYLYIFHQTASNDISFYWSWTLFIAATGLSWALFAMTPK